MHAWHPRDAHRVHAAAGRGSEQGMSKTSIEWTDALRARFWSYVDRRGPGECWNWIAGRFSDGMRYGQFRAGKRKVKAHRAAYELLVGPIPDGLRVLHRCDNPLCCNSLDHHFIGTDADNAADRAAKGRSARGNTPVLPAEFNPSAKLSWPAVRAIREERARGALLREIAARHAISPSQVRNIVSHRSWREAS